MQNVTGSDRRATRDIDLDFIRYSLTDDKIKSFVSSLNCLNGISITILGPIIELKHENYRGRRIEVSISDGEDTIKSKLDIGIHKHLELKQKEYCFDVCMDDEGASLLINSQEQMFAEKLYSLLKLGIYSERYKDIYDMYFVYYGTQIKDVDYFSYGINDFISDVKSETLTGTVLADGEKIDSDVCFVNNR